MGVLTAVAYNQTSEKPVVEKVEPAAKEASEVMNITAQDLKRLKVIEEIIPEFGGADKDTAKGIGEYMKEKIMDFLKKYDGMTPEEIVAQRYDRFRAF